MILNRRRFLQISAASLISADTLLDAEPKKPAAIRTTDKTVVVKAGRYSWQWSQETDIFNLRDKQGRVITEGPLQPAILVKTPGADRPICSAGKVSSKTVESNRLTIAYEDVNHGSKVRIAWRFDEDNLWLEPVVYATSAAEDVIALHYFAKANGEKANPSLPYSYLVQPGISESSDLSPIIPALNGLDMTTWLGHGGDGINGTFQQWGLPSHYFCGATSDTGLNASGSLKEHLSDAFCCGLAELPAEDFLFHLKDGKCCPVLNVRSDLWGQSRGPGALTLGATLCWAIGANYRDAIREYYLGLVRNRIIKKKINSAAKNAAVTASAFDTWGAQVAAGKEDYRLDEQFLNSIYDGVKRSGMKPEIFIVDEKWEGKYGLLQHSEERFPNFEAFLAQLRSDGHKVGLWAAFLRCEDPQAVGLRIDHMIRGLDGKPMTAGEEGRTYHLYDVTQPEVQTVLIGLLKRFMKRYKPDLVKFDFGYELPSLSAGAPHDMTLAGERLFMKSVQVIVGALREVNPDVAVMYYSLSPLFIDYFDLHSPDDMFDCVEDYEFEANRRFFFSSLLGEIGMPTYGSAGYDWTSARDIWFDSAVVGSIGSLGSFSGDEQNSAPTPELIAKYNGLAQITRQSNAFTINPLDPVTVGSLTGAHSSSWVRIENSEPVLVALRKTNLLGGGNGPGRYKDIVQCDTSVVVASKTEKGISRSTKLGIVPYGDGELVIRHLGTQATAIITTHLFGRLPQTHQGQIQNSLLRVPLRERIENDAVVEWLEVELS